MEDTWWDTLNAYSRLHMKSTYIVLTPAGHSPLSLELYRRNMSTALIVGERGEISSTDRILYIIMTRSFTMSDKYLVALFLLLHPPQHYIYQRLCNPFSIQWFFRFCGPYS
jgi:hypothetical protein